MAPNYIFGSLPLRGFFSVCFIVFAVFFIFLAYQIKPTILLGKSQNIQTCFRVSKIFYLVRFHIFEPYQSSKHNIKQLKNKEKQWKIMKKSENQWNKNEKYNKSNETYGKKSTQWKASKYRIWSHVTPGSRKYSILSVFIFLSLIKSPKITLNNWKTLENNKK